MTERLIECEVQVRQEASKYEKYLEGVWEESR